MSAIDRRVALFLAALFVDDTDYAVAIHDHVIALRGLHGTQVRELDDSRPLAFERALLDRAARRTPDVKRPHGQLGPWFTDRLRRQDTTCLAQLHQPAGGKVAAVALDADAASRLAGEDRA